MDNERIAALQAILAQTEVAHGDYEAAELHGVYDQAWATWYAVYAVDHGIGDALGRPISADELAAFFTSSWAERTASDPEFVRHVASLDGTQARRDLTAGG